MITITAKAQSVSKSTGITDIGSIINTILQIFKAFSACGTPSASVVHQSISTPNRSQERALERVVRRNFRWNPAVQQIVLEGVLTVGQSSSISDTSAMYLEANGISPSEK